MQESHFPFSQRSEQTKTLETQGCSVATQDVGLAFRSSTPDEQAGPVVES